MIVNALATREEPRILVDDRNPALVVVNRRSLDPPIGSCFRRSTAGRINGLDGSRRSIRRVRRWDSRGQLLMHAGGIIMASLDALFALSVITD